MKNVLLIDLLDDCRTGSTKYVKETLDSHAGLDLLYKKGMCFKFAIKFGYESILNMLIDYYIKNITDEPRSLEYNIKMYKMKKVLEESEEQFNISDNIQVILDQYISQEQDSDEELTDLDTDFVEVLSFDMEGSYSSLTEQALKELSDQLETSLAGNLYK